MKLKDYMHPMIIENVFAYALGAAQMPAYLTYVTGKAGTQSIAGGNILHNALMFTTEYSFSNFDKWRNFVTNHLWSLLALDGIAHTVIALLLMFHIVEPSAYVLIVPLLQCTVGSTVACIWRQLPNILIDHDYRRRYDQANNQAKLVGCLIGNLGALLCALDLTQVCILLIVLAWLDNVFLMWVVYKYKLSQQQLAKL